MSFRTASHPAYPGGMRWLPVLAVACLLAACSPMPLVVGERAVNSALGPYRDPVGQAEVPILMSGRLDGRRFAGSTVHGYGVGEPAADDRSPVARAWRAGAPPAYGVLGHQGDLRARWVGLRQRPDGRFEAVVRALHPRHFQLTLLEGAEPHPLATTKSVHWGPAATYAEVAVPLATDRLTEDLLLHLQLVEVESGFEIRTEARLQPYVPDEPPPTIGRVPL